MPLPFESEEYWVHPEQFQISYKNKEHVSKVEQTWINHYGTLLGYDSIEEQRNPNLDEHDYAECTNGKNLRKYGNAKRGKAEDEMNDFLMGDCSNSQSVRNVVEEEKEAQGINGVIKLNVYRKLGRHRHDTPCLILSVPDKHQSKFHVRLAAPFETEEYWLSPHKYQIVYRSTKSVSWVERQWVNYHQRPLGYDSIELQQQCHEFI